MLLQISSLSAEISGFLWSNIVLYLCLFSAIYYTIKLKLFQFKAIKTSFSILKEEISSKKDNSKLDLTNFQALSASISGAVGLGNIAGVAIAIQVGGVGSIFWMWIAAFIGMSVRYAETLLAIIYQDKDKNGQHFGGPIYYIKKGLKKKYHFLATLFAVFTFFGTVGTGGMFQSNQIALIAYNEFGINKYISGAILAILVIIVTIGGVKKIGRVAERLVPFMCIIYVGFALFICLINIVDIPSIIALIVKNAFIPDAAIGGGIGAVIVVGFQRAVFSNESGLGTSPIIYGAVKKGKDYFKQASISALSPFVDTIIVCSSTAFVIILSGEYHIGGSNIDGIMMTKNAFASFTSPLIGAIFLTLSACLFGYSTMITWSYYGEISSSYLFGKKYSNIYKIFFALCILIGANFKLGLIINISDSLIALMVIPNTIAILLLWKKVIKNNDFIKGNEIIK